MNTEFKSLIDKSNNIVIICHFNPDGDAVGSSMALYNYLSLMGKESSVVFPNHYAKNLFWLDEKKIIVIHESNQQKAEEIVSEADLIFCLDFQTLERTEKLADAIKASKAKKVLIDHHIDPSVEQFDMMFSNTKVSSTCEMLYKVICSELDPDIIDSTVANCLYAGLCTDTGSFSFSCRHKELFLMIADLIDKGLDTVQVHQNIFDTYSQWRMKLLGFCLENMIVKPEYKTAYIYLSKAKMKALHYQPGDTEGIVNYCLSIEGISFAAFFTERESRIRCSFRSTGDADVNVFARENFDGGGHKNAAGASSFVSLKETIDKFEKLIPEFAKKNGLIEK
ncbi:MAG: bifunctional oligoribonuclease/PAP phosphatase NrnA [Bacteroidales bacterium]|jgi:phosphoesterase RecJ-like protein|nr:bifunctional oligoribonuclease/PAP phosphatase NrnA [Bacteroidales bacterium]